MYVLGNKRDTKTNEDIILNFKKHIIYKEEITGLYISLIQGKKIVVKRKIPDTLMSRSIIQRSLLVKDYKKIYIIQDEIKNFSTFHCYNK